MDRYREGRGEEFLSDLDRSLDSLDSWVVQRFMASPVSSRVSSIVMSLATITLVDAETLDAVIGLFEAQLREHKITTSRDDLRAVTRTVIADRRHGFILVARAPDGSPIGVAYASSLLSLEHGGVSGWIEELYVSPQWRGRGIGSRLLAEVVARAKESGWRASI